MNWYIWHEGQEIGPYLFDQIRAMAVAGQIAQNSHIRQETGNWLVAGTVPGLFLPLTATPVPVAPVHSARQRSLVEITNDGQVSWTCNSQSEANLILKQLEVHLEDFCLRREAILDKQDALHEDHFNRNRQMRPILNFFKLTNVFAPLIESNLANKRRPLEDQKRRIEKVIAGIQRAIIELKKFIWQISG